MSPDEGSFTFLSAGTVRLFKSQGGGGKQGVIQNFFTSPP